MAFPRFHLDSPAREEEITVWSARNGIEWRRTSGRTSARLFSAADVAGGLLSGVDFLICAARRPAAVLDSWRK